MVFDKHTSMQIIGVFLLLPVFIDIATGSTYLDVAGIRLVNGTGPFSGRVEVSVYGVWGTVCDDSFDMNDAKVMCRMMNLQATAYVPGAFYGQGIGPIFAQEFECNGNEQHIKDCEFVVNVQCTHAMDISIVCTECGEIDIFNGYAQSISKDGSVLTSACRPGFRSSVNTSVCEAGTWSVPSISCKSDISEIRLANGIGLYDGRVELLINGTWGTICSTSFLWHEARAICNILFGKNWYRTYFTSSTNYGAGSGPIYIDNLDCKGTETDINECTYSQDVSCTDHDRDVAVACNVFPLNIANTRLINGTGPDDGRIELNVDGHWGTIDRRFIDMYDAQTICNTHNASLAMYFNTAMYGKGTGPVLTREMYCNEEKDAISSCRMYAPYRPQSSHLYDLSIVCTPCGIPDIYNGDPVTFNETELTVSCHTGFYPNQVKMKCLPGESWFEYQRCTSNHVFPLPIDDIQLADGYRPSEGRVEIMVNGTWGTICDTDFDVLDGMVICNMFGLKYSSHYLKAKHYSGRGTGPIYVDKLDCNGTEYHLNMCSYEISSHCTHYDDVAVVCTGYQLEITDIRLAGTNGPYHGRVELEVNGTWGTVCDDRFSWTDVSVVCNMFGLKYKRYFYGAYYGQGSGPIYVDRLDCPSYSSPINDCSYAVNNFYNCGHDEDVSVMCYGPKLNITDARLVNGTGPYDGRAEIKINDTWGTICDENFNIQAADLFCSLLGLRAAQYFTGAIYGEGSGQVFIDQLFCDDNDYSLSSCDYLFLNECSHDRDISVVCNDCGQPDIYHWGVDFFTYNGTTMYADCSYYRTYVGKLKLTCDNQTQTWITEGECQEYSFPLDITGVRMIDGPSQTNGRVELKSMDDWGTVCDDSFGIREANAICSMLGYPPAVTFFPGAYYGPGKGPIFVDDLSCEADETHINNCTYNTYDNCNHDDDVSVVCTDCGDPKPEHGFVNSTESHYGATVHVTCEKDYTLVGDNNIVCQINGTWSNVPNCKLIDCGDPRPANGNINTTSTVNTTVAKVWCKDGYTLIGDSVITCQSNETWTSYPACEIIDCRYPETKFADVTLLDNKTTFGETVLISCWTGYTPIINTVVSCLANGSWEEWQECEIVDCGNPVPQKGSVNSSETTYNTVLEIICDEGFNLTGQATIKCQANGIWTDYPVCDTANCGQFSVINGEVDTSLGTTIGSSATVMCDEGYNIQGSSEVTCTSTGWNESVFCNIQVCEDPTPDNGKVSDTDSNNGFVYGNYANVECDTGYNINGDSVITCESNGSWSDTPTCKLIDCGNVAAPINGHIDDSQGTTHSAEIKFYCNEDFFLVGDKTTVCGENGKWNNQAPTCAAKLDVGGHCLSQENCLMENSRCNDNVCTCITGIYDPRTKKCDTMPLLPYGDDTNDTFISDTDVCGPSIMFPPGMPVSGKMRRNLYVCSYGFVSFDTQYTNPTPPQDINSISTIGQNTIIAAFYGPIDKKTSGPVYYRSYDILNSYNKMQEDADVVSYIENIVMKFGNLKSYKSSFILIATWHETTSLGIGFDTSKTSTFQAVLVSDGKSTYVFYIFGHGLMEWENNVSNDIPVWVGASMDIDDALSFNHPYAFQSAILQLDTQPSISVSENDVAGLFFKPLNQDGVEYKNEAIDCITWYNENYKDKKHLDYIASLTPECPCDIWLSRFDPWFWRIGLQRWRTDVTHACVDMLHVGNFGHYGKSCCYDLRTWLWVYERPLAGGFQLYHPRYQLDNILNDVIPKTKCCVESNYCNLYYELRPTGSCYVSSSYDFGTFWGDPHFITLDRKNFTFNGLGEFTLLHIQTETFTFELQARTERAIKKDGNLSDATVFSAFAVKDSSNASLHVEINKAKTGINLYYGKNVDLTNRFYASTDPEDPFVYTPDDPTEGNIIISKRDEIASVLFPTSGIMLNISVNAGMLSLNTGVPKGVRGLTKGLLGNYDGNPDNDFIMPNGTVLEANLTEREVFQYGMTWSIQSNESAFIYEDGKTHLDYHNDSYVPRFLDEADPAKRAAAEKACNGSQNIECVFDLVSTENMEIAEQTSIIKGESESTQSELEVTVPTLTGCDVIFAEKGRNVSCNIMVDSGNEVYFLENNVNATIDAELSSISYFQTTDEPVLIRVASKNEYGRFSPSFVVNIIHCTNCSGHGVCKNQPRDDSNENDHFRYAQCVCEPQYQGNECEQHFNGCAANPCSLQRECISLTAEEQKTQNRSYICGPCPAGFKIDIKDECHDVDECAEDMDSCEQICINKEGRYTCACDDGFRVDSRNSSKCKDINECEHALHNCTHICNNTEGGFHCQCYHGFEFDAATWSCIEVSDGDTCNESEKSACSNTSGCTLVDGKPECFCTEGYELDELKEFCQDIDECSRGVCPHDCVNTNGSFHCVCFTGYQLQGPTTCTACRVPYWGNNCEQTCVCTGRGADKCDPVKGCVCKPGWQGETCDNDINECLNFAEMCDDPRKTCTNYLGSYKCVCMAGYHLTDEGNCEDTEECSDVQLNNCMQDCTNTVGSFSCSCRDGYTKHNETSCTDIDECEQGTDKCEQRCTNNIGLYTCACHIGYTLNDDRQSCSKLSDPCFETNNLTCSHFCVLSEEEAVCGCQHGYNLAADNELCTDINECEDSVSNKCDSDATCINTAGSFECECPVGKQLENDGRTCSECDKYHYGKNCLQNCSCLYGKCDKTIGCVCDAGWVGNNCDIDINECDIDLEMCQAENTICVNLLGGAVCSCETGYRNNSGICQDIDECGDIHLNSCDQQCINSEGSYSCTCQTGFVLKQGKCTDVDECIGSHECNQDCENTVGSYICSCEGGFRLDLTDRKSCKPEDECNVEESKICTDNASCFLNNGVVSCTCMKGFQPNGDICEDIDECKEDVTPCSQQCNNTDGSFVCSCDAGYYLQDDRLSCRECNAWKYGHECNMNCSCDKLKTEACNPETGMCICKPGWNGTICGEDVDECNVDTACPNNSMCKNIPGSYECKCNKGYLKTGARHCEECDLRHFGDNCLEECTCNIENTQDCHHETGECVCKQGWSGINCTADVDECKEQRNVCYWKPYSSCQNSVGSFYCICKDGFADEDDSCTDSTGNTCDQICLNIPGGFECDCKTGFDMDNGSCIDIDECEDTETCHQVCNNTIGSFTCTCESGFSLSISDRKSCKACKEWTYGFECNLNCSCEVQNTEMCDSRNGDCTCKTGWNGTYCEDDINECANKSVCPEKSLCLNFNGSFDCICDRGYFKTNDKQCKECEANMYGDNCSENCTCNIETTRSCNNLNGSCYCKEGWRGARCSFDIDECAENNTICQSKTNSTCKNEDGSYKCLCDDGFREQSGICTACKEWTYGFDCKLNCSCDIQNTEICDSSSGDCTCKTGWNGTYCEDDVNECINTSVCPEKSLCVNYNGSFDCICDRGYFKTKDNLCNECEAYMYGDNCSEDCSCNVATTRACDNVNGLCSCKQGWTGDNCSVDINECETIEDVCTEKANSACNNTSGSYNCKCNTGFTESENMSCAECTGSTYGENCSNNCNCNATNSVNKDQTCDRVTGNCECKTGWNGDECNADVIECDDTTACISTNNTTCVNTFGSFRCDCLRGFKTDIGGICVQDVHPTTQQPGISLDHNVTIETDLPDGTNLDSAETFNTLLLVLKQSLLEYFSRYTPVPIDIIINDIRSGSIIVDYTIVYGKTEEVASKLTKAVLDLEQGVEITLNGENISASSNVYKDMEPCEVYLIAVGSCEEGFQCRAVNNTPTCRLKEADTYVNWSLVIGLSGSGIFLVLLVAITVVFLRHLVKRQKMRKRTMSRARPDNYYQGLYGHGFVGHQFQGWQNGNDADTERRILNWRHKLSGPFSFRSNERYHDYSQPYHMPRAKQAQYHNDDWF